MAVTDRDAGATPRTRWLLAGLVFALAVWVFLPIRNHAWLNYDDNVYVTRSAPVLAGVSWNGIRWAFTSFDGANWFPLTRLSWMIDAELRGLDSGGFLVTNLALHALASAILCLALAQLTGAALPSAFVAALFAVHPLHVESVAWVAARKDPLSAVFFALALLVYAQGRGPNASAGSRAGVFAFTALGLLAKPIVVVLPFVLLLLDAWPLGRLRGDAPPGRFDPAAIRAAVVEKWPLFALVGAFAVVTVMAQRSGGTIASLEQVAFSDRVANAVVSYAAYLEKMFWPTRLAVFYPHAGENLAPSRVAGAAGLLFALTALAWWKRRRHPYLGVGWLWYLGTLVPVIGIIQVGSQSMADRYTYLPLIGIGIAVAWGARAATAGIRPRRLLLTVAGIGAIATLTTMTSMQLRHWRDSESLFRHALAVTRDNHVAHSYLGTALLERGDVGGAVAHYKEALRLRRDLLTVTNNLAWLLATTRDARHRDPRTAVDLAERAAAMTAHEDAAVLDTLAAAYASAGRFDDAQRTLERALHLTRSDGDLAFTAELETRLALYRARRAHVEPADPGKTR